MAQLHMASIIIYLKMLKGKPEKDRKKTKPKPKQTSFTILKKPEHTLPTQCALNFTQRLCSLQIEELKQLYHSLPITGFFSQLVIPPPPIPSLIFCYLFSLRLAFN